jgi:1,4-alpha-glucan branching enzyme
MSIERKKLKSKPICKVKFSLSGESYNNAETMCVSGEFNDWSPDSTPMKKSKVGVWSVTVDLETGKEYQFRYLINNQNWENDPDADKSVPSGHGSVNSVIVL